jgi:hypothetical protein
MRSHKPSDVYGQLVRITHVYLGPAADRFIFRQVQNHLHKSPEELTPGDLDRLIDWIKVAVSLITEDSEIVEEYTVQLHKLVASQRLGAKREHHGG